MIVLGWSSVLQQRLREFCDVSLRDLSIDAPDLARQCLCTPSHRSELQKQILPSVESGFTSGVAGNTLKLVEHVAKTTEQRCRMRPLIRLYTVPESDNYVHRAGTALSIYLGQVRLDPSKNEYGTSGIEFWGNSWA
jgi:hypothetical protein